MGVANHLALSIRTLTDYLPHLCLNALDFLVIPEDFSRNRMLSREILI